MRGVLPPHTNQILTPPGCPTVQFSSDTKSPGSAADEKFKGSAPQNLPLFQGQSQVTGPQVTYTSARLDYKVRRFPRLTFPIRVNNLSEHLIKLWVTLYLLLPVY